MRIVHVTYARVAADAVPGDLVERPHDREVDAFLLGHLDALRALAAKGEAPFVYFSDADSEKLFADLKDGSRSDFLASATHSVCRRLDQRRARLGDFHE